MAQYILKEVCVKDCLDKKGEMISQLYIETIKTTNRLILTNDSTKNLNGRIVDRNDKSLP